jgi:antibiotic biosynthesis monooxygenase (ABM) superfamily enzyme
MFQLAKPLQRALFMIAVWVVVFPASLALAQGLAHLAFNSSQATLLRSGILTAILVIGMELIIIPLLQRLMSWLFVAPASAINP